MGAIYDGDYYDDKNISGSEPLTHTRIGYDNFVTEESVTASTALAGFDGETVGNSFTYEFWKPSELPATLNIDAGELVTADYIAFGAHKLSGCEIRLSYSSDGSEYTEARKAVIPRDRAAMLLFDSVTARFWRVEFLGWAEQATLLLDFVNQVYEIGDYTDAGDMTLGVLYMGQALAMQRPAQYQGHTPGEFARNDEIRPNVSEGGQWLGRSVVRKGYSTSYEFSNLKASWVRNTMAPFLESAIVEPFFIAFRPEGYADEVLYGWVESPIVPTNSGPRDLMSVSFNVSAHGGIDG